MKHSRVIQHNVAYTHAVRLIFLLLCRFRAAAWNRRMPRMVQNTLTHKEEISSENKVLLIQIYKIYCPFKCPCYLLANDDHTYIWCTRFNHSQ